MSNPPASKKKTLLSRETLFPFFDEHFYLILLSIPVGLCVGLVTILFNRTIVFLSSYLNNFQEYYYYIFFPSIGAFLSVFILSVFFREGSGHSVPIVIYSVFRKGGLLRFRSSISHLLSCIATIASGGSAGPEGPIVVSGASFGSNIACFFKLKERQRIILLGGGIASAISAIFNAPITGLIFALEIVLGDWLTINIVPIAMASITANQISHIFNGNQIPFDHITFSIDTWDVLACILLAILCSISAIIFSISMRKIERACSYIPNTFFKAILGGLGVGIIGMLYPEIFGEGYEFVHNLIENSSYSTLDYLVMLLAAKILATSLTLGTGSAGGVFAPSLVIGCIVGHGFSHILHILFPGNIWASGGCFALIGMAGTISGVLLAPLTGVFLIVEITGEYEVMVPLILVSILSSLISRFYLKASIYHYELVKHNQLLRPGTDQRILADTRVKDILFHPHVTISPHMKLRKIIDLIKKNNLTVYPVVDQHSKKFIGFIHVEKIFYLIQQKELYDVILAEEIVSGSIDEFSPNDSLIDIVQYFEHEFVDIVPITENEIYIGVIRKNDIFSQYRKELILQTSNRY